MSHKICNLPWLTKFIFWSSSIPHKYQIVYSYLLMTILFKLIHVFTSRYIFWICSSLRPWRIPLLGTSCWTFSESYISILLGAAMWFYNIKSKFKSDHRKVVLGTWNQDIKSSQVPVSNVTFISENGVAYFHLISQAELMYTTLQSLLVFPLRGLCMSLRK